MITFGSQLHGLGFLLVLAVAGASYGAARAAERPLAGVADFAVLIEALDEDSAACGITGPALEDAIEREAAGAPFHRGGKAVTLYLRVSTLPKDGNCFSSVDMEAYYLGTLAGGGGSEAKVELWSKGTILITRRAEHPTEVASIVRRFVRGLVQDWRRDNS